MAGKMKSLGGCGGRKLWEKEEVVTLDAKADPSGLKALVMTKPSNS